MDFIESTKYTKCTVKKVAIPRNYNPNMDLHQIKVKHDSSQPVTLFIDYCPHTRTAPNVVSAYHVSAVVFRDLLAQNLSQRARSYE